MYMLTNLFVFDEARTWKAKLMLKLTLPVAVVVVLAGFYYRGLTVGLELIPFFALAVAGTILIGTAPVDETDKQYSLTAYHNRRQWEATFAEYERNLNSKGKGARTAQRFNPGEESPKRKARVWE